MKTLKYIFHTINIAVILSLLSPFFVIANDIIWKKNFGGSNWDVFLSNATVSDGVIAVGHSYSGSFGNGDWIGYPAKGNIDAIIVKYDNNGNIVWKKNFGAGNFASNYYTSVTEVSDGVVVVGSSSSFGTGDWVGVAGKGGTDAIIVKYDNNGNVVWKKNFGGNGSDYYESVEFVSDGIIAVGSSSFESFGNGDWGDIPGIGHADAIIVKYDYNGNIVWKKNYGIIGNYYNYNSLITVPNGNVVLGSSWNGTFMVKYDENGSVMWGKNTGGSDLATVSDGFIVIKNCTLIKYDFDGNSVWERNYGESGYNHSAYSIKTLPDGIITVGQTVNNDAIVIKYDNEGNVRWRKTFGGNGSDLFNSISFASDGIVAVGQSDFYSFGSGDWGGVIGKGNTDATIVKYEYPPSIVISDTWKKNFGGNGNDRYISVSTASDGIVAVGYCSAATFGNGDWVGFMGKGNVDAIIVKYNSYDNIMWKNYFGGTSDDYFNSVKVLSDGIVTAGYSTGGFGVGDLTGMNGKGGEDAIILKYDLNGTVIWKKNFGGNNTDRYLSIDKVSDGIVAVGYSNFGSFGNGDWLGFNGKGSIDAIIVKYDNAGNVVWKKNFGGNGNDYFNSVSSVSDGIIVVGHSEQSSFNNGDWTGVMGNGNIDAIIVKYDNSGNIVWKKNFGNAYDDFFHSVTEVLDGIVVVGHSEVPFSYGSNDTRLNNSIMIKYDNYGNVVKKQSFGGQGYDYFRCVTKLSDEIVTVGYSSFESFNNGDWTAIEGRGANDATIAIYSANSNLKQRNNFGGNNFDYFSSVTVAPNGIYSVGYSNSFGTGDWVGVIGKGGEDAIIVKFNPFFISVATITNVPKIAIINTPLILTCTILPNSATNKTIVWSIVNAGTTGATITSDNIFNSISPGIATIKATITNGITFGTDFVMNFDILVVQAQLGGNITITGMPVFNETLTANTANLTSSPTIPNLGTLSYQWKRGTTNIGTNSSTYILVQADIGNEITVTVTAANCTGSVTSAATATITKANQIAPAAPTMASKTATSITLNTVSGCEYRRDNGAWQTSTLFSGLMPNTTYSFTQRKAETGTHLASPASEAAQFKTDNSSLPTYTIIASVNNTNWGTITPAGACVVEEGKSVTFTIISTENGKLEDVKVNGTSKGAIFTFTFENVKANGTIEAIFVENVGINENMLSSISIYPNPTTGELRIESVGLRIEGIEIYDIIGENVYFNHLIPTSPNHHINISHLKAGLYLVKIQTEAGEVVKKVLKE